MGTIVGVQQFRFRFCSPSTITKTMSNQQNDEFYESVKEAEEETKMKIEQEIYQCIESMKFVQKEMSKLLDYENEAL